MGGFDFYDQKELQLSTQGDYATILLTDRVIDIISSKNKKSDPFFLLFSTGTPHTPILEPPEEYPQCQSSFDIYGECRYNYCNMILEADKQIGRVIDALKDNDLWDDTVLIFSTDNGGRPNTEPGNTVWGSCGSNLPLRGQKAQPWEAGNRGIGFINGGYLGLDDRNMVNNKLYHVVDWYKTIISDIGGINLDDDGLDSMSIWQSILNEDVASPRNEWVFSRDFETFPTAIRQNDWKLVLRPPERFDGYWDVNDRVLAPGQNESETVYLFNITDDEIESINLKDLYPDIVEDLEERLLEVRDEGFTLYVPDSKLEGYVIAVLSGSNIPFLELTQDIKIDLD